MRRRLAAVAVAAFGAHSVTTSLHATGNAQNRSEYTRCGDPACNSRDDSLRSLFRASSDRDDAGKAGSYSENRVIGHIHGTPLSREELGVYTWSLIHSIAGAYPLSPTEEDVAAVVGLITGLARLYPCQHCREDFVEAIREHPIAAGSRKDLVLWACHQHNLVNQKLGKPVKPCDFEQLDVEWRTGKK